MPHWLRFAHEGATGFGLLEDDEVAVHEGDLFDAPRATGRRLPLAEVEVRTPVTPQKMIAMANNFRALLDKLGRQPPTEPHYFLKSPSSFHPTDKPIRRPPGYEGKVVFEGELGLVIGRQCRAEKPEQALGALFGCTCVNDVTAFDWLNPDPSFQQWTRSKAPDTFGVFGPVVATGLDAGSLTVRTRVNGDLRQDYPVSDMVFTPAELISHVSHHMTLLPGDVIACGTSVGAGSLKPGSVVEIEIDGVGVLTNTFE